MMPDKKKHIETTLEAAREAASQIKEVQLRAEVLTVIAIVSNDSKDLAAINGAIGQVERGSLRSETIVAIAKKMAKAKKFVQAREMVYGISAVDNYWRAEACAIIALYSRDPLDFGQARRFASMINSPDRKREVLFEIDRFEQKPDQIRHRVKEEHSQEKALADLVQALTKIRDFEKAHRVVSQIDSAYQRARAFADMARILAAALHE